MTGPCTGRPTVKSFHKSTQKGEILRTHYITGAENNASMDYLNEAIKKIEAQQPKEQNAVWMVGEQLKDMLRREPHLAELVSQDLNCEQMTIAHCEKKLKEFADKNKAKSASCFCVSPAQAEKIIREFYGLTEVAAPGTAAPVPAAAPAPAPGGNLVDLTKFF